MNFYKHIGWQSSPLTEIQKAFVEPGEDFGGKVFTPVTLIDEGYLTKSETERQVFLNIEDARQALAEALERGDAVVKSQDLVLFDRGRIRLAVAERIYPTAGLNLNQDGTPLRKSGGDPVRAAYRAHAQDPSTSPVDMRAAARELDDLIERLNGR